MKTRLWSILAMTLATALVACQKGGQLTLNSTTPGITSPILQMGTGAEFVSSSAPTLTSLFNGYQLQNSVGDSMNQVQQSSPGGYQLYSTVQGEIISSE
jgi:hypothetical protein